MQVNYTSLFFLFFRLLRFAVSALVPFLKHRRDTTLAPIPAPRAVPAMLTPAPARTPEKEAEGQEYEEERKQRAETSKAEA